MNNSIQKQIENMSVEELRTRLAEYMNADLSLRPPLVAVEVRLAEKANTQCRYDVLLIDENGEEIKVKFHDRYSRLLYIYSLLHPTGYQRRALAKNNYSALCHLYHTLYFLDSEKLLKTIDSTDVKKPGQFINQYVTQARRAIREASPIAEQFVIDRPQSNNGKLLIPFISNGGTVIIDASLSHYMSNV